MDPCGPDHGHQLLLAGRPSTLRWDGSSPSWRCVVGERGAGDEVQLDRERPGPVGREEEGGGSCPASAGGTWRLLRCNRCRANDGNQRPGFSSACASGSSPPDCTNATSPTAMRSLASPTAVIPLRP